MEWELLEKTQVKPMGLGMISVLLLRLTALGVAVQGCMSDT